MRTRQIKPSFWSDEAIADIISLEDPALFFIGLWQQADDSGYFRWNPRQIAAELYPYRPVEEREEAVRKHVEMLVGAKRVRIFKCGHGVVPKLTDHQRFSAATKQVHTFHREHQSCRSKKPTRGSPRVPAVPRPVRLGQVRSGSVSLDAQAHESNTVPEHEVPRLQRLANGTDTAMVQMARSRLEKAGIQW